MPYAINPSCFYGVLISRADSQVLHRKINQDPETELKQFAEGYADAVVNLHACHIPMTGDSSIQSYVRQV